jgi:hypothetical protein
MELNRMLKRSELKTSRRCLLLLGLFLLSGCGTPSGLDPALLAWREKFVLVAEPANAVSLAEAKSELAERSAIVVTGKIGGTELEPFESGKASFIISELPQPGTHSHAEGEADNCPFCKRRAAKAPKAIVQFLNDKQEVIPFDARELFDVDRDQVVTITGEAKLNSLDMLVITANGVYRKYEPKRIRAAQ